MIKCEKCGKENQDNAKFCNNCGAKIEIHEDVYICSKCGGEVRGKPRFCTNCGAKLVYAEGEKDALAIPKVSKGAKAEVSKKVEKANSSEKKPLLMKISNIVITSLILVVALLTIISMFLPFATSSVDLGGYVVKESTGLKYWFSDCWKPFKEIGNSPYKFGTVVNFMSFLVGVVLVLTFGIITIVKGIMSLISGKENKRLVRSLSFAIMGALQYFVFTAANFVCYVTTVGLTAGIKTGSGYGLILACLFILVAIVIAKAIIGFINHDMSLRNMVFYCIFPLLVSIVVAIAFIKPFYISELDIGKSYLGVFPIYSQFTTFDNATARGNLLEAFLVLICAVVFAMCLLVNTLNTNNKVRNIVFSVLLCSFLIFYAVFGKTGIANAYGYSATESSTKEILNSIKVNSGLIVGIVFCALTAVGGIVQAALGDKKQVE